MSFCTALPLLLGPCACTLHGLQSLMSCILPLMHFRSQHCWELLYLFALHYQHGCNKSQHGSSCCVHLHVALLSFGPKEAKLHTYLYFYNARSNRSLGKCVQHFFKVMWELVYWLRCQSVAYHFKPLLCDTRLTRLAYLALFSRYNTPGISEMKRPMFHHSTRTSGIIFKNGVKQKRIQCFNSF